MAPKPLSPAQTLWLFCESAGFVIVMDGVFIEVVIFWCGVLVTIWCTVSFQYIVVVPDVLEVSQLRLQLVERCLIVFFPLLQRIVLLAKRSQRGHTKATSAAQLLLVCASFRMLRKPAIPSTRVKRQSLTGTTLKEPLHLAMVTSYGWNTHQSS